MQILESHSQGYGEPPDEDHRWSEYEEGERGGRDRFAVAREPAAAADPTECPLDHPPSGLNDKALLPGFRRDDLDHDSRGRADAVASVGAVSEAVCQEGEEPA